MLAAQGVNVYRKSFTLTVTPHHRHTGTGILYHAVEISQDPSNRHQNEPIWTVGIK